MTNASYAFNNLEFRNEAKLQLDRAEITFQQMRATSYDGEIRGRCEQHCHDHALVYELHFSVLMQLKLDFRVKHEDTSSN